MQVGLLRLELNGAGRQLQLPAHSLPKSQWPFSDNRMAWFDPHWLPQLREFVDRGALRVIELTVCLTALVILAPLLAGLALLIWLQDFGNPIFVHRRLGRGGVDFPCLKFRSMVMDADAKLRQLLTADSAAANEWARDHKLRSDPRITGIGTWLRKSSLDELPQLLNVLRGDMSLVGPRPIVASEVFRYGHYYLHYCSVRPGITGLWQVSGRNDLSYRRRVVLDTVYARTRSLGLDLIIMLMTVPAMLSGRGSS